MNKGTILTAALAALMLTGPPAQAREPRALEPSTDWLLDYADERCTLTRGFGEGRDALRLQVDSHGSAHDFRILLAGRSIPASRDPSGAVQYRLTPDTTDRQAPALLGKAGQLNAVFFTATFGPDVGTPELQGSREEDYERRQALRTAHPDFEASVSDMRVALDHRSTFRLQLGDMTAPLAALRACLDDLYAHWGLDPERQKTLSMPPFPDESTVARTQRSYPGRKLTKGESALIPVRVMVDAEGKATSCHVQSRSADEAFSRAVCEGLAGPYRPALDAEGRAVASVFNTGVVYIMQ